MADMSHATTDERARLEQLTAEIQERQRERARILGRIRQRAWYERQTRAGG